MEVIRGKELILIHEHALLRNCLIIVVFAIFVSWGEGEEESEISRSV